MEAMIERCAGLDVHQETVVVCVLVGPLEKKPKKSI
jgi:transposase